MSERPHVSHLLDDYADGTLPPGARGAVERHLATCRACRDEHAALQALLAEVEALPAGLEPRRDLWPGIQARLGLDEPVPPPATTRRPDRPPRTRALDRRVYLAASVAMLLVVAGVWLVGRPDRTGWGVTTLAGTPLVNARPLSGTGSIRVGEWLETDAASEAEIEVGRIGAVTVAPGTRLQLVDARRGEHRLSLAEGSIHATIDAPPLVFFVETPSGLAIDLGCEYTLRVDSTGEGLLHVLSGYVALVHAGEETVVPAGWMGRMRQGHRPGAPFAADASPAFRAALERFDFGDRGERGDRGEGAFSSVLTEARPADALTLWVLMHRVGERNRAAVYDRLAELVEPPPGVTRAGVLGRVPEMTAAWRERLEPNVPGLDDPKKKARLRRAFREG